MHFNYFVPLSAAAVFSLALLGSSLPITSNVATTINTLKARDGVWPASDEQNARTRAGSSNSIYVLWWYIDLEIIDELLSDFIPYNAYGVPINAANSPRPHQTMALTELSLRLSQNRFRIFGMHCLERCQLSQRLDGH